MAYRDMVPGCHKNKRNSYAVSYTSYTLVQRVLLFTLFIVGNFCTCMQYCMSENEVLLTVLEVSEFVKNIRVHYNCNSGSGY